MTIFNKRYAKTFMVIAGFTNHAKLKSIRPTGFH
jgi:hypothetical protein